MSPSPESIAIAATLVVALSAYALFAGADFGGGIWDLLAGGPARGAGPRALIDESITPIWEANHVWLILALVLMWSSFPPAFAAIMTTMFVPLSLSLLGIFLRGTGLAFRHSAESLRGQQFFGAMFAASSLLAPFFLGTVVGAIATGGIRAGAVGNSFGAWTSLTALLTGGLSVSACAYVGAVYLVVDARRRGRADLVSYFGTRAGIAAAVAGLLAVATLASMHGSAPYVFHRLLGVALPLVAVSVAAGITALLLIVLRRTRGLRVFAAITVATAVWGWGAAQYPWLLPKTLSLAAGSAPEGALAAVLAAIGLFAVLVVPALLALFWMQQHDMLGETETADELRRAAAAENRAVAAARPERPATLGVRLITAAVVAVTAGELIRSLARKLSGRSAGSAAGGHRAPP